MNDGKPEDPFANRLLLVDGMAILFRAYYATAYAGGIRRTSAGVPVNAVHGFVRYFMNAVGTFRPTHVACCWDTGGGTFRSEQFADYKMNRPEAPIDLVPQFDLVKEVVESFGVPNVEYAGFEADDCIGTLARRHCPTADVFVLTGDQDLLQLVDDRIAVVLMMKGQGNYKVYTPQTLMEERQLTPRQIIDVKALMGDASDNYPGVRGIGEKTALKLIRQYESVEGLLERLHELSGSVRAKIEADLDMLHLSRKLATIRCNVPVSLELRDCLWAVDRNAVERKFEELEFGGLAKLIV
ncbi:5'-3' exonuclease [Paenibacillus sp. 32O-W]|uniref:5'-3' exonuclease n=1 Tax=Paenibacillus cisolokensis TaxID=1658519 RepID=A0ABQ4NC31_9BACL|nr:MULTISPECIES: 5'-3' exonuclease H3TH domain-containing protein [Paenibacillus]ALS29333.1 5'-3' exonuclease [Paenibacillus sp. 32O-W]GIQ65792.1 5'-3' exonuclease [Paenibacillus cisolokensis]